MAAGHRSLEARARQHNTKTKQKTELWDRVLGDKACSKGSLTLYRARLLQVLKRPASVALHRDGQRCDRDDGDDGADGAAGDARVHDDGDSHTAAPLSDSDDAPTCFAF